MRQWDRAAINGVELEYLTRGDGEPIILVHAGMFADWFDPLLDEPSLAGYRILSYHRIGYAGSSRPSGAVSIADQAAHCRALMRHVGIERAHLVGHSSGGNIALQLALDAPEVVHTLALLEPALTALPGVPPTPPPFVVEAMQRYGAGDRAGAVDSFMLGVCGPAYRDALERVLPPGALAQAVADADTFFVGEQPAVRNWPFGPEQGGRVTQPVLAVLGAKTSAVAPMFGRRQEVLLTWLPRAEAFILEGATHLLHVQNPRGMADGLAAFFARYPLSGAAQATTSTTSARSTLCRSSRRTTSRRA